LHHIFGNIFLLLIIIIIISIIGSYYPTVTGCYYTTVTLPIYVAITSLYILKALLFTLNTQSCIVPVDEAVVAFVARAAALEVVPFLVPVTNSI